jgi:hypothetical protein
MSKAQSPIGVQELVTTKYLPNPLKLDERPELSADLDAKGHSIAGVKDLACQTINGQELKTLLRQGLDSLADVSRAEFAPKSHNHPELQQLRKLFDNLLALFNELPEPAAKVHKHSLGDIEGELPLGRLEKGFELAKLLQKNFSEEDHRHLTLENALAHVTQALQAVQEESKGYASQATVERLEGALLQLTKEVKGLDQTKTVPAPAVELTEIIGIRRVHIPKKCHEKKIQEIAGRDESGEPIKVTLTRFGKDVAVGTTVHTDDILLLSPSSASVRLLFS